MPKAELKGALFFSDQHPQITGYLVIGGIEYEIAGWHASEVRSEISARERGPVQTDIFGDARTGGDDVERDDYPYRRHGNDEPDRAGGAERGVDPTE